MKHAKKMMLVDIPDSSQPQQHQQYKGILSDRSNYIKPKKFLKPKKIYQYGNELDYILNRSDISERDKWLLYNQTLRRLLFFLNEHREKSNNIPKVKDINSESIPISQSQLSSNLLFQNKTTPTQSPINYLNEHEKTLLDNQFSSNYFLNQPSTSNQFLQSSGPEHLPYTSPPSPIHELNISKSDDSSDDSTDVSVYETPGKYVRPLKNTHSIAEDSEIPTKIARPILRKPLFVLTPPLNRWELENKTVENRRRKNMLQHEMKQKFIDSIPAASMDIPQPDYSISSSNKGKSPRKTGRKTRQPKPYNINRLNRINERIRRSLRPSTIEKVLRWEPFPTKK